MNQSMIESSYNNVDYPSQTESTAARLRRVLQSMFASRNDKREQSGTPPKGDGTRKGGPTPTPTPPPGRNTVGVVIVVTLLLGLLIMFSTMGRGNTVTLDEFRTKFEQGEIESGSVTIHPTRVTATQIATQGKPKSDIIIPLNSMSGPEVSRQVLKITQGAAQTREASMAGQLLWVMLPLFVVILLMWFLLSRSLRGAGGGGGMLGNFGKSRHRTMNKEMTGITFADVAGIEEAKEEVNEIVEFLKNPRKFTKLGGRIPRGVLLVGDPGVGKTLLAKAIAGEADVPFFSISGSDFVEMFVGVGASRVRDLFKQAKESSPCIIFLDEIDAVGRKRGGGFSTGGHDERDQTLNAILVEMDGFSPADGVIVIAATNRVDVLDPALIRPGRFDRQVTVPLPDVKGRLDILTVHARKIKMSQNVNLERIARGTPGFSGADLAAIVNEAAIAATMRNKDFVEHEDMEEARDKVKFGRSKKSRVREKEQNKLVAYHEAGHAVLQAMLPDADPLHKVTIIPRGSSGGATFSLPEKDRMGYGLKWLRATQRVLCGGRIAESRAMDDVSTGASMDIAQVTSLSRAMITEWGMSERLGFIRYAGADSREVMIPDKDYSDTTARLIDEETRRIVDEAYSDAATMLDANWQKVVDVAEALLKHETLTGEEVHQLMRGEPISKPTVAEMLVAQAQKAREAAGLSKTDEAKPATNGEGDVPPGVMPA